MLNQHVNYSTGSWDRIRRDECQDDDMACDTVLEGYDATAADFRRPFRQIDLDIMVVQERPIEGKDCLVNGLLDGKQQTTMPPARLVGCPLVLSGNQGQQFGLERYRRFDINPDAKKVATERHRRHGDLTIVGQRSSNTVGPVRRAVDGAWNCASACAQPIQQPARYNSRRAARPAHLGYALRKCWSFDWQERELVAAFDPAMLNQNAGHCHGTDCALQLQVLACHAREIAAG